MTTTQEFRAHGYRLLADVVPCGKFKLSVWQTYCTDGGGWDYLLSVQGQNPDDPTDHLMLYLDRPIESAPDAGEIARVMIKNKFIRKKPAPGYEYAFDYNGNKFGDDNFYHKKLRDRAVDELIMSGHVIYDMSICRYEIAPDGSRPLVRASCVNFKNWIRLRRLADPSDSPASRLRVAILMDDTEDAEAALRAGASPMVGCQRDSRSPLMLAAATMFRGHMIALMAEISPEMIEVNAEDADGNTALHAAAEAMETESCIELLNLGASVRVLNDFGETPLDLAASIKGNPVTDILLAASAREVAMEAIEEIAMNRMEKRP